MSEVLPGQEQHAAPGAPIPFARHEAAWRALVDAYTPRQPAGSIWAYSRAASPDDPAQGWKLRVSATILSAPEMFRRVAPVLTSQQLLFKVPRTLADLKRLNCGVFSAFSQVGKCLTIYLPPAADHVGIAQTLDALTHDLAGPIVPFDQPFRPGSVVSYRYGAFGEQRLVTADGIRPAIQTPSGSLVPDIRGPGSAVPAWLAAADPFQPARPAAAAMADIRPALTGPLAQRYRAYAMLVQRGKGGVYHALDLGAIPVRRCLLKEGRQHGETDWDGRDGRWRVTQETTVLRELRQAGVDVPEVYDHFTANGHAYLVAELIPGRSLQHLLNSRKRKPTIHQALVYSHAIASHMARVHASGWVWRDCKPHNLILLANGRIRPIDFEGASRITDPDPMPWGTQGYVPPEWLGSPGPDARLGEDLYALGQTIRQLLTGATPGMGAAGPAPAISQRVPEPVRALVARLSSPAPQARPPAQEAVDLLASFTLASSSPPAPDRAAPCVIPPAHRSAAGRYA